MPMFQRPAYPVAPSSAPVAAPPSGLFGGLGQFRQQNPGVLASFGAALAARSPASQGFQQAAQMMQANQAKNATAQYLLNKGLADNPEEAAMLASNPTLMQTLFKDNLIQDQFEARKKIAESMGMDPNDLNTRDYMLSGQFSGKGPGGDVTYGLTPQYYRKKDGTYGIGVLGSDRSWTEVDLHGNEPLGPYGTSLDKAIGAGEGKPQGEARANLASMKANLPGLTSVVQELGTLSDQATYTPGGQLIDSAMRWADMEPREAAVARTKYMAMVDNQVLPLLRETFGAQFTVQEGESLRATLGAPDKTPREKKAVLEAFIEQKKRNIEALEAQTGQTVSPPGGGPTKVIGGKVYYQDANGDWFEQ